MNRANGKGNIFETNVDRHDFVKTLADACEKTGFMFISELVLAARLRRETTLTLLEIAARLQMGSWKSFRAKLDRWKKSHETLEPVARLWFAPYSPFLPEKS